MASFDQVRRRGRWSLFIGALFAALTLGAVFAYADTILADADLVTAGSQTTVDLGTVAPGATLTPDVHFLLNCAGNKHVDNGQSFSMEYFAAGSTIPAGGSMSATSASIGAIPSAWPDDTSGASNCGSPAPSPIADNSDSTVTIGAPTVPGPYTFIAQFKASALAPAGLNDTSSITSGGTTDITFTLTVSAPSNNPPTDPGAPTLDGASTTPNNTGNFTVDWAASTDPDALDTVTYELQKHDASTVTWTSVATGLTTNSYTFTNENEGSWTYRVQASDNHGATSAWATDSSPIVVVDKTAPNTPTAAATTSPAYTDGSGDNWWKDTVTVSFTANGDPNLSDGSAGSGVDSSTLSADQTFTTLGLHTASGTVKDNATNESLAGTLDVYVDNSTPTASFSDCPSSPLILGSSYTAHWTASDTGSGLATAASGSVSLDTSTVGSKTAHSPAPQDNVGHTGTAASCAYSVVYDWTGFFQPVDNLPALNVAKAGSAIPVKFNLGGNQGLGIFPPGYPLSSKIACDTGADLDTIETTVTAGGSSLTYDTTANQYIYVWKSDKAWAGTCRQLDVKLNDGTDHYANFKFTK